MPTAVYTMPYAVSFVTMTRPNPSRIGTAEERVMTVTVWAHDAEEAVAEVRRLCTEGGKVFTRCLDATVPVSTVGHQAVPIARELILNDAMCVLKIGELE